MRKEGPSPNPQFRIEAYYVDFAFPDVKLAVEADRAAYHSDGRKVRDCRRDGFLWRRGWTVKRFCGTTIRNKPGNCALSSSERFNRVEKTLRNENDRKRPSERSVMKPLPVHSGSSLNRSNASRRGTRSKAQGPRRNERLVHIRIPAPSRKRPLC